MSTSIFVAPFASLSLMVFPCAAPANSSTPPPVAGMSLTLGPSAAALLCSHISETDIIRADVPAAMRTASAAVTVTLLSHCSVKSCCECTFPWASSTRGAESTTRPVGAESEMSPSVDFTATFSCAVAARVCFVDATLTPLSDEMYTPESPVRSSATPSPDARRPACNMT